MQLNIKYDDNSLLILPYAHYKGNIFFKQTHKHVNEKQNHINSKQNMKTTKPYHSKQNINLDRAYCSFQ